MKTIKGLKALCLYRPKIVIELHVADGGVNIALGTYLFNFF